MSAAERNDRALALLLGGQADEADGEWAKALAEDPEHFPSALNRALTTWRRGLRTDVETLAHLEAWRAAQASAWPSLFALGLAHLERRDLASATAFLTEATAQSGGAIDVTRLLESAQAVGEVELVAKRRIERPPSFPLPIALAGDGAVLLVGEGKDVVLRRPHDFEELARLAGHADDVTALAVTPDGCIGVSGSDDGMVRVWDLPARRVLHVLRDDALDEVLSVAVSEDGRSIVCACLEPGYALAKRQQGRALAQWHAANPGGCALPADITVERVVHLFRLDTGERRVLEQGSEAASEVRLSADARSVILLRHDFGARPIRRLDLTYGRAAPLETSQALRLLAPGSGDTKERLTAPERTPLDVRFAMSGDSQHALFAAQTLGPDVEYRHTLRYYDLAAGRCLRTLPVGDRPDAVQLSRDGRLAVTACSGKNLLQAWRFPAHWNPLFALQPSPATSSLAPGTSELDAAALRQEAGQALAQRDFPRALDLLRGLREHPGHARTAETQEAWARLYRVCVRTGLRSAWIVRELELEKYVKTLVRLSPEGSKIALATGDPAYVTLQDTRTGRRVVHTLPGTVDRAGSLDWSGNARFLAAGGYASIVVWDLARGQVRTERVKHFDSIKGLRLGPYGRYARFASHGGMKTWDGSSDAQVREDALSAWLARHERARHATGDNRFVFVLSGEPGAVHLTDQRLETSRLVVPEGVLDVEVSRDGQWLLTTEYVDYDESIVRLRYLDWELAAGPDADFDESARPWLDEFLSLQAPPGAAPVSWEEGFDDLLFTLACAGHGRLRPEGVRRALLGSAPPA